MKYRHFGAALAAFFLLSPSAWTAAPPSPYEAALQKLSDKNPSVRKQGADALGELRNPAAAPALAKLLTDASPQVRGSALDALGVMRVQSAGAQIVKMLESDPDGSVRQTAAIALSYIGNRAFTPSLIKGMDDAHDGTRFASVNSLAILRDASAVKALTEKLNTADPRMRKSVSYALAKIQDKSSVPAILDSLKVSRSTETQGGKAMADPSVAASLLRSLGEMGDKTAVPRIKPFLNDPDPQVKAAAAHALAMLGDNPKGKDSKKK